MGLTRPYCENGRIQMGCKRYGVVHAVFACKDCGWQTGSYKNGQAIAAIHARSKGHTVEGEIGVSVVYGPD